jgi:hypothetical protein
MIKKMVIDYRERKNLKKARGGNKNRWHTSRRGGSNYPHRYCGRKEKGKKVLKNKKSDIMGKRTKQWEWTKSYRT